MTRLRSGSDEDVNNVEIHRRLCRWWILSFAYFRGKECIAPTLPFLIEFRHEKNSLFHHISPYLVLRSVHSSEGRLD
jgi:hypothetical protein